MREKLKFLFFWLLMWGAPGVVLYLFMQEKYFLFLGYGVGIFVAAYERLIHFEELYGKKRRDKEE